MTKLLHWVPGFPINDSSLLVREAACVPEVVSPPPPPLSGTLHGALLHCHGKHTSLLMLPHLVVAAQIPCQVAAQLVMLNRVGCWSWLGSQGLL